MKRIKLHGRYANNRYTLVDDADYELVSRYKWTVSVNGYAISNRQSMHRLIMGNPMGLVVDHKNQDRLDNTRSNLRVCTRAENTRNHKLFSTNQSGFKGVSKWGFFRWEARIVYNYQSIRLGVFDTPEEAAAAYDAACLKYHGEFASPNEAA